MRLLVLCSFLLTLLSHPGPSFATGSSASEGGAEAAAPSRVVEAPLLDGKLFDPGVGRDAPAEKTPALAKLVPWLGDWLVDLEIYRPGQEVLRGSGRATFHFMNRGHAIMERARIPDFDSQGHAMHLMTFYAVDANGIWTASEGSSWTEAIRISSGGFDGEDLVLHDAMRPGGGPLLLLFKRTHTHTDQGLEARFEVSNDVGSSWAPLWIKRYRRATAEEGAGEDFLPLRSDVGAPAPDRASEAGQFDFLIGDFDADHWLKRGDSETRWRSRGTAVHALGGYAILEFDWHELDPSLPDAATTILRIYNRAMRRWESLFLTNRSNSPLYFGGVQEGDEVVLHPFDAQTGANPLSQWIFYDMKEDTYRWKGLRSIDRGSTWQPTWTIEFARRDAEVPPAKN